ncbi:MAG: phospholipase [Mucilaginibacter sp.]|nr:phospholipase [Mucilaginibacter sp.]
MKKHDKVISTLFIGVCSCFIYFTVQSKARIAVTKHLGPVLFTDTIKSPDPLLPDYTKAPLQEWEKKFSAFSFNTYVKDGHTLPYRFYKPEIKRGKKYPLVIFFHGAGERGLDNRVQFLRFAPTVTFWEKYPCYVIAPLCPQVPKGAKNAEGVWVDTPFGATASTMKNEPTWPMALAMEAINKVIAENKVDPKRIYVTGLSMGGFATWEILQREDGKFAAAIPICGGGDLTYAAKFTNLPLWIFHGDADKTVPVTRSRDMVAAITRAGGNPKYTEYPGVGHDAWGRTYSNPEVWDWLFAQVKK